MFKRRKKRLKAELANESLEYLQRLKSLTLQLKAIYEKSVKTKIEKDVLSICKSVKNIMQVLIDDNSKMSGQRLLIDYYLPELLQILNQYIAIKTNNLSSTEALNTLEQIENFLPIADNAFKKLLENKVSQSSSDIDIDIKIMMEKLINKKLG